MKYKVAFLILTILSLAGFSFSQQSNAKFLFDVLDENGNFFKELKVSDIKVQGLNDLSLNLLSENSLEIMIMIDASASQEMVLPLEKQTAQTFITNLLKSEKDKVAVVSFTGKIQLEQDSTNNFQKAKDQIEQIKFQPLKGYIGNGVIVGKNPPTKNQTIGGSTSIWDSLNQILKAFSKIENNNNSQRIVLLISDGVNTSGEKKMKEAIETSIKTAIPIYAIGIGDYNYSGVDKKSLKKITEETGGISVVPNKKLEDLSQLLQIVEQSLRSNYALSFTPNSLMPKDKLQEIKLEIINPEFRNRRLQIIQPKGVFISN